MPTAKQFLGLELLGSEPFVWAFVETLVTNEFPFAHGGEKS